MHRLFYFNRHQERDKVLLLVNRCKRIITIIFKKTSGSQTFCLYHIRYNFDKRFFKPIELQGAFLQLVGKIGKKETITGLITSKN
ncbi:MAG: hypothetical protein JWQ40_5008 [Segetibacter sp.]|nr:hypothetical protein [Segetibacter sp.]